MQSDAVSPRTTLAIILGAAEWPNAPALSSGPAFSNSAAGFKDYLAVQFGLSAAHILDLFDDNRSPSDLDEEITRFLRTRSETLSAASTPARDLVLYYVGHGGFFGQDYYLAIRATRAQREGVSGLRMSDLARTINEEARSLRRYLILDCCFAGAAFEEFQAVPADVAKQRTLDHFPKHGTAMLCASGPRDPARAPKDSRFTLFSGAMLTILRTGVTHREPQLSLKDVGDETLAFLRDSCPDDLARPQVLSPDVSEGDVATVRLFPNAAHLHPDLRFQGIMDEVAELTRRMGIIESRVATITMDRDEGPVVAVAVAPAAPKEPDLIHGERRRADRFFLTDTQWSLVPPAIRMWLHRCRRAALLGWFWVTLAGALTVAVVTVILVKTVPAALVWTLIIVLGASVVLTATGFIRSLILDRQGEVDCPEIPTPPTAAWHTYDVVVKYATNKSFKVVGGLYVSSPFFEIAAIFFIVAAAVISFFIPSLLGFSK